ncbi:MAG: hypothetical protein ACFB0C_13795 [Leptolyngbyaceae cyanobacterium]
MTSNSSFLIERARRGHVNAIADLLNQSFSRRNLKATVERQGSTLRIIVEGELPPAPEIATQVERGLRQIRPALIKEVLIYGQRPGDLVPQWSESFDLAPSPPAATPTAVAPVTTPAATPTPATPVAAPPAEASSHSTSGTVRRRPRPKLKTRLPLLLGLIVVVWVVIPLLAGMFGVGLPNSSRAAAGWAVERSLMTELALNTGGILLPMLIAILGLLPMAIQEGTVLLTGRTFRLGYWTAFSLNLITLIFAFIGTFIVWLVVTFVLGVVNGPLALFFPFLIQAYMYGVVISPPGETLGFGRGLGLTLFVDMVAFVLPLLTLFPLLLMFS